MAKERGRHNHPRVIAAAEDFQVGSASERGVHADHNLPLTGSGDRNPFDPDIFLAVEHGSVHLTYHAFLFYVSSSIMIFIEVALGSEATAMAATASVKGKRCEISRVRSNPWR